MLTRFLLSFFPCIRTIWHRNTYFLNFFCCFSSFLEKKVGIFGICWDISEILTDLESAFKTGSFEHLKTIVAWILATRTFLLTQFLRETFDFVKSICEIKLTYIQIERKKITKIYRSFDGRGEKKKKIWKILENFKQSWRIQKKVTNQVGLRLLG